MRRVGIILDSNFFFHYQGLESIPWPKLIEFDDLELLFIAPVVRELDAKKFSGSSRERSRAQSIISKLKKWTFGNEAPPLSSNISIQQTPDLNLDYAALELNPKIVDDQIIGTALTISEQGKYTDLIILTADFGLQLRLRAKQLRFMELAEEFLIQTEGDPIERENSKLKNELNKLKLRQPILSIGFGNETTRPFSTTLTPAIIDIEERKTLMERLKIEHPPFEIGPERQLTGDKQIDSFTKMINLYTYPSIEQRSTYNSELESFYGDYEKYLDAIDKFRELMSRTIKLPIRIMNTGSAAAHDISVHMHFPDGFELLYGTDILSEPNMPVPPRLPTSSLAHLTRTLNYNFNNPPFDSFPVHKIANHNPPNVTGFSAKRTNSYDVEFEVRKVQHQHWIEIETILITFPDFQTAQSFEVDYSIYCDETPEPTKGRTLVKIEKS